MDANIENTLTLSDVLELYALDRTPSKETIKLLQKIIRIFINDTGIKNVSKINKHSLNIWKRELLSRISSISCNSYLRQLKSLISFAVEEELIEENPFKKFRMVKEQEKPFKSITQLDVVKLIDYLRSDDNTLKPSWFWVSVIRTFYYTGIRRKQLVGLKWDDIDFNNKTIILKSKYSKTSREWTIPLHNDIYEDFIMLRKRNSDRYGTNLQGIQVFNVTVFNQLYQSKYMTTDQVSGFFKKISQKTKVKGSAHRFRHRLATDLANKGNVKDAQKLLGHSNIQTTLGYVHTDIHQMRKTLNSLTPIYS